MKYFMLKNRDGSVQIMQLVPQADGLYSSPGAELAKWTQQKRDEVVSWREIDPDGIPSDRAFRNAWCDVTAEPVVDIDMPKARDIHRNRLRSSRAPKLAALDVEFMRAIESGDKAALDSIARQKQALRDITKHPDIEAANTPDQLKSVLSHVLSSS